MLGFRVFGIQGFGFQGSGFRFVCIHRGLGFGSAKILQVCLQGFYYQGFRVLISGFRIERL